MTVLRYVGYAVFFIFMFVLSLYYTFPWDAAKDRVLDLASKSSGMTLTAGSLQPSWITGFVAKDVKVTPAGSHEPIQLEEVHARAKLLTLLTGKKGVVISMPLAKGDVDADVVVDEETATVRGETRGIELGLVPGLGEATGMPLTGTADLKVDLTLGTKDPKLTTGQLGIKLKALKLEKGGKVGGFPIPELPIGDIDWQIPVEAGKATFKSLKLSGDSLDLIVDGTIMLMSPIARSNANLTISFKPTEKLLSSEPLLGALLNNIQRAKSGDGFYTYAMTGSIKTPRFVPKKK